MPTIAVTFDPDGSIEFTRAAQLDWLFDGAGVMKRVTDIKKLPNDSLFYVFWLMGPYAGKSHGLAEHIEVFGGILDGKYGNPAIVSDHTGTFMFRTYNAAVEYEIECLNAMRKAGVTLDADQA